MPRSYSGDLRRRGGAAAAGGGQSRDGVARRFAVGRSTVYRWVETLPSISFAIGSRVVGWA